MKLKDLTLISMFIALITAGAFIRIPLPICPITLQILFTTLAGILLGGKNGAISVAGYVLMGLLGIPVFTEGGGFGYVFNKTFGFLIGFIVGAFVSGIIAHSGAPTVKRLLIAGFAGLPFIFGIGTIYCYLILRFYMHSSVGIKAVMTSCLLPLPGDIGLCVFTAFLGKKLITVVKSINLNKRSI